jgi:hypothetical protein
MQRLYTQYAAKQETLSDSFSETPRQINNLPRNLNNAYDAHAV